MKIQYYKEPALKEDHVDVHFREETEKIGIIRDFFSSFEGIMGKRKMFFTNFIQAVFIIWKLWTGNFLLIRKKKCTS